MSQVTLYLDSEIKQLMVEASQAEGVSQSRWVAKLIRDRVQPTWPQNWQTCLGAFPDFPLRDEAPMVADVPRIGF